MGKWLKLNERSFQLTIIAVANGHVRMGWAVRTAIRAGGQVYQAALVEALSLTDHSLSDLAALDHPYARRHGSLMLHAGPSRTMRDGRHQVHTHSGTLVGGVYGELRGSVNGRTRATRLNYFMGIRGPRAYRRWRYIVEGTRTMLPRDPLAELEASPRVRTDMRRAIIEALGQGLRSQAHVRFGPMPGGAP